MAETTDRPQAEIGAMPSASEEYRPLSLLALASFVLAVLYAVVVVVGGLVALLNRVPWLMPMWAFIVPVAALLLAWAARLRIRDSEGTLSGLALAAWALRLVVVVGLSYAAYYGATFFVVRMGAVACADRFFAEIKKGRADRAFLISKGAEVDRIDEKEMRDRLENLFNAPTGPRGGGPYSQFRRGLLVHAISMADGQAHIVPTGVIEWEYKGGYRVVLKYHVSTPSIEFDAAVEAFGRESKPGEPRGRRWQVDLKSGQTGVLSATRKLTPLGEQRRTAAQMAGNFAGSWQEKVNLKDWKNAYLDTLTPDKREELRDKELDGRRLLAESGIIHIDDEQFWTGKAQRENILRRVLDTFHEGRTLTVRLQQMEMPLMRVEDGRIIVRLDANLIYMDDSGAKPEYIVTSQLVVSAAENEAKISPARWRVDRLELESGRTPPVRPPSRSMPGGA